MSARTPSESQAMICRQKLFQDEDGAVIKLKTPSPVKDGQTVQAEIDGLAD